MQPDTTAWLWLLPAAVLLALLARVFISRQQAGHWKIAAFDGCRDLIGGSLLYGLFAPPVGLCAVLLGAMLAEREFQPAALLMGALLGAAWFAGMGWSHGLRSSVVPALSAAIGALVVSLYHLRHN